MRNHSRKHRLNNSGLTLIELIVAIAIIAIFSGVVLTYITSSSNFYRNTSSNSKVQMETQETFDKIEDMIINANRGIYYGYGRNNPITYDDIKSNNKVNSTQDKIFAVYESQKDNLDIQRIDDEELQTNDDTNDIQTFSSNINISSGNQTNYQPQAEDIMSVPLYFQPVLSTEISQCYLSTPSLYQNENPTHLLPKFALVLQNHLLSTQCFHIYIDNTLFQHL